MSQAIALENVRAALGGVEVLHGVSLVLAPGEVLALVGPSGSGKTTLLRTLTGFVAPTHGAVHVGGRLASVDGRILMAPEIRGLGMVFQDLALWPHLTVHGNLAFVLRARKCPRAEREARIEESLRRVGLLGKITSYPSQLSGGERQRVAIARALVHDPVAVLLDEPLSNLDVGLKRDLLDVFRALLREQRSAALYVTHDPREVGAIADRVAVLERGRVVQEGTPEDLAAAPASEFVCRLLEELG